MTRSGLLARSGAGAPRAARKPSTRTIALFIAASGERVSSLALGEHTELRGERTLDAAMLGLDLAEELAGFYGLAAARRRLKLRAMPAQHAGADVRAA